MSTSAISEESRPRVGLDSAEIAGQAPVDKDSAIADPGPLGLGAFALTTFMLSVFNAGMVGDAKLEAVVLPVALFYGGIIQLLAGMWEFKKNNTFGAVAFSSYGAFWLAFAAYVKYVAPALPPADVHTASGIFLLGWTIHTAYMALAAARTNVVLFLVVVTLFLAFAFLTLGAFNTNENLTHVGGYIGLVVAALAWYGAAAAVTNATWGRRVLPVFPLAKR